MSEQPNVKVFGWQAYHQFADGTVAQARIIVAGWTPMCLQRASGVAT